MNTSSNAVDGQSDPNHNTLNEKQPANETDQITNMCNALTLGGTEKDPKLMKIALDELAETNETREESLNQMKEMFLE